MRVCLCPHDPLLNNLIPDNSVLDNSDLNTGLSSHTSSFTSSHKFEMLGEGFELATSQSLP